YDGCGCPSSPALACDDDACGTLQSLLDWPASAGQTYTLQIGHPAGQSGGSGSFTIQPAPPLPTGCRYDDGGTENVFGLLAGGEMCWMHRFGEIGQPTTVSSISTAWGSLAFPGFSPPNAPRAKILIWDDPNDDGDPTDCVLIQQVSTTIQNVDSDILNTTSLIPAVVVNGYYFVGAAVVHSAGQYVGPLDQSTCL